MAQSSYTIANGSGAVVRARLNEVAAAIQSSNSGGTAPTETVAGMLWFDTSVSPAVMRQRNAANTEWMVPELRAANNLSDLANAGTARTNLGATTTGAALFTAANAAAGRTVLGATTIGSAIFTAADDAAVRTLIGGNVLSTGYSSAEQTITSGGALTLTHGLGAVPMLVQPYLICKTAQHGYQVGDIVPVNPAINAAANIAAGLSMRLTSTQILIRYGVVANPFEVINASDGNTVQLTSANWRLIVRAFA